MPLLDVHALLASLPGRGRASARASSLSSLPHPPLAKDPTDDIDHIDGVPDEVVVLVCLHLAPSCAVKLSSCSRCMRSRLKLIRERIDSSRIRLDERDGSIGIGLAVSAAGSRLTSTSGDTWKAARCGVLAREGTSTWSVRLTECKRGYAHVGVSTADGAFSWSLAAYAGHCLRMGPWDPIHGCLVAATEDEEGGARPVTRMPGEGYEGIAETSALQDVHGWPAILRPPRSRRGVWSRGQHYGHHEACGHGACSHYGHPAAGAVVKVTVDHDAGVVSLRVQTGVSSSSSGDGAPELSSDALSMDIRGFPAGAALCPFVALYDKGDEVVVQALTWSL